MRTCTTSSSPPPACMRYADQYRARPQHLGGSIVATGLHSQLELGAWTRTHRSRLLNFARPGSHPHVCFLRRCEVAARLFGEVTEVFAASSSFLARSAHKASKRGMLDQPNILCEKTSASPGQQHVCVRNIYDACLISTGPSPPFNPFRGSATLPLY